MKHFVWLAAMLLGTAACTEELVSPGGCPSMCPGGEIVVFDTVLTPVQGADSSHAGYASPLSAVSLLLSNGGDLGDSRALVRFIPRGDTLILDDTTRSFTVDSALITLFLQARDTTVGGLALELYRLPESFDSATSRAEVVAAMTPEARIRTVAIHDSVRSGSYPIRFSGAELSDVTFPPGDSGRLVVGIRLTGPSGAGVYLGAAGSGTQAPLFSTFVTADIADTLLQEQTIVRAVSQNLSLSESTVAPDPNLLGVGGNPAERALIRFPWPSHLRDSVTIIRATLELTSDGPMVGIPGDSARIDARAIVSDFGAKSVPVLSITPAGWVQPDDDVVFIDVVSLVELWQGSDPLPSVLRLNLGQEYASFLAPRFRSTASATGQPRLRITYRHRFPFGGF